MWTLDECADANGFATVRPDDGSMNGNTDLQPIATVYDAADAPKVAAAPVMLEALIRLTRQVQRDKAAGLGTVTDRCLQVALDAIATATCKDGLQVEPSSDA